MDDGRPASTRISLGLDFDSSYFGRIKKDRDDYSKIQLGKVSIHTLSLLAALELRSRTNLSLRLPFGLAVLAPDSGPATQNLGLGDLELSLSQELLSLFRRRKSEKPSPFQLYAGAGIVAPSGRYDREDTLSATEISAEEQGKIGVSTYNAQASLGAGAWSPFANLSLLWRMKTRFVLELGALMRAPISRTPDEILWGVDSQLRASGTAFFLKSRLGAVLGMDYRRHEKDQILAKDENTESSSRQRVGGRDELAVHAGLQVKISSNLRCGLQLRLPFWQRVGGVQLVESVSGQAMCLVQWG